ncbi:hypothetical protein Emed_006132 [Eimeria media]
MEEIGGAGSFISKTKGPSFSLLRQQQQQQQQQQGVAACSAPFLVLKAIIASPPSAQVIRISSDFMHQQTSGYERIAF